MTSRAAMLVLAGMLAAMPALDIDPAVRQVLTRDLKFSAADLADIARGKVERHSLDTKVITEVAVAGATWINAPLERFLDAFRDIARFKKDEGVLQIGRFSDPPTLEDMAALTVDDDDLDGKDCKVSDCSVRLPARELVRFRREIDWKAHDAKARAAALFKQMLFAHVHAYWTGEGERISEYNDDPRPIRPREEFAGILNNSPYVDALMPGLAEHLRDFPASRSREFEDFLYWSKERFGIAPFITITHITITRLPSGGAVITSKDVYSSRYIDSSMGLTIASGPPSGTGFVLVYVNRTRASALRGGLSGLRKAMVERRSRSGTEASLRAVKARLEPMHP
jgi:hypothetical protein